MNGSSFPDDNDVATKRDIRELRGEFGELRDEVRGFGVQLEQMGSNLRAVIAGQQSLAESISRNYSSADAELAVRVGALEQVVARHSGDLTSVRADVSQVRAALEDQRSPHPDLVRRVAVLEAQLASR